MQNPQRIVARIAAAALVPVVIVLASAGQASAEPPSTWVNTDSFSGIDVLLIYVGIPLALFLVVGLFGLLTHTSKAHTYPIRREQDGGVVLEVGVAGDAEAKSLDARTDETR